MIGMGIGLTILLDATVIRSILLPATMALMGDYVTASLDMTSYDFIINFPVVNRTGTLRRC